MPNTFSRIHFFAYPILLKGLESLLDLFSESDPHCINRREKAKLVKCVLKRGVEQGVFCTSQTTVEVYIT